MVFSLVEDLLSEVVQRSDCRMSKSTRQCHHCHRLLSNPEHAGIGSGVKQCTLNHYELCPGGRKTGPVWTGCPSSSTEESDKEESRVTDGETTACVEGSEVLKNVMSQLTSKLKIDHTTLDPYSVAKSLLEEASKAEQVVLDRDSEHESSDDEEETILQSEIEKLRLQVKIDAEKLKAEKKEKKRLNRERLEHEKAELLRQSKAQHKKPSILKSSDTHSTPAADYLHQQAADLAARQQKDAADRRASTRAEAGNLTIGNIRALPGKASEVEQLLASLQALVPSLAKTPTAPSQAGSTFQPTGVFTGPGDEYDTDYVFHPGRGKFVPVVHSPARGRSGSLGQHKPGSGGVIAEKCDDGGETSADEDCAIEPPPGYKLVWKRDSRGEKYFVQKKAKPTFQQEMVQTYVCDESTGRWYKRNIPKADLDHSQPATSTAKQTAPFSSRTTPSYRDHRTGSSPVPFVRRGCRTPVASAPPPAGDRVPGIVPIDPEKQGKDSKIPDRVQWARNCPVNWTNKVTTGNINAVLWAWSYVAEILATRTGMAPNLECGELEARLQHFCHVLEITLQTSGQADFSGDSWAVARLYDRKVQQKVDSKMFSWVQLSEMNHGASMPHELIAATQELAKKPRTDDRRGAGEGKKGAGAGDGKGKGGKKSWKCPTWNKSETRGKCSWELENAPEKCQGVHECSWCKSKNFTPVNHQRHFCKKRLEEEDE